MRRLKMSTEIRPVKIGMMSFAHMHAGSYAVCVNELPNVELAGIADDNKERGLKMAELYNTKFFESYEELLRQEIHGVIICSENSRHKGLTIMAAEAGKHVLCEKPLAPNIEDGRQMIAECKKHGVKLQTAFPCRFSPVMIQARQDVLSGQIGKILAIKGTNRGRCPGGWFTELPLSGGGAVIDHTVHVADLIRWTTGAEINEVYAEIDNKMLHKGFDDMGMLTFTLDNGVFATLDPSWSRPPSFPFWGDVTMAIVGTDGTIWVDLFKQTMTLHSDDTMRTSWEFWGDNIDLWLVKSFTDSIATDKPVEITGEDGLAAAAAAIAAYESAKRGMPVKTGF